MAKLIRTPISISIPIPRPSRPPIEMHVNLCALHNPMIRHDLLLTPMRTYAAALRMRLRPAPTDMLQRNAAPRPTTTTSSNRPTPLKDALHGPSFPVSKGILPARPVWFRGTPVEERGEPASYEGSERRDGCAYYGEVDFDCVEGYADVVVRVWGRGFVEEVVHVAKADDAYDCYADGSANISWVHQGCSSEDIRTLNQP